MADGIGNTVSTVIKEFGQQIGAQTKQLITGEPNSPEQTISVEKLQQIQQAEAQGMNQSRKILAREIQKARKQREAAASAYPKQPEDIGNATLLSVPGKPERQTAVALSAPIAAARSEMRDRKNRE